MAQTTTNFNATFNLTDQPDSSRFVYLFMGTGQVGSLGSAFVSFNANQQLSDDEKSGLGQAANGYTLTFNRLDSITVSNAGIPDVTVPVITVTGRINRGTGAYAKIANPAASGATTTMTLTRTSTSPLRYNMSITGSATLDGKTVSLNMTNVPLTLVYALPGEFGSSAGTGTVTPFGSAQISATISPRGARTFSTAQSADVNAIVSFSQNDTLNFFGIMGDKPQFPLTITGGTGAYAGASGSATVSVSDSNTGGSTAAITGTVTIDPSAPLITSVQTAYYHRPQIAQNSWIEIKGNGLVPASTPAGGTFWSDAPEFAQGKMPTQVGNISVSVNGKPAYIWWFCSAKTTPTCSSDQINVLTPLDDAIDQQVLVVVKNGSKTSAPYPVQKRFVTPSALLFDAVGHPVATHADASLLGPATLFPGSSTPAKRGETVTLWTVGFGPPTTPLAEGSSTQRGTLPSAPDCALEGTPVPVAPALVSPGLYQINITVPENALAGDNHLLCTYETFDMPGMLLAVQ
jgi:uncharacterized protein (TIGR03437 family)